MKVRLCVATTGGHRYLGIELDFRPQASILPGRHWTSVWKDLHKTTLVSPAVIVGLDASQRSMPNPCPSRQGPRFATSNGETRMPHPRRPSRRKRQTVISAGLQCATFKKESKHRLTSMTAIGLQALSLQRQPRAYTPPLPRQKEASDPVQSLR